MKAFLNTLHEKLTIKAKLIIAFLTVALLSVVLMGTISYITYTQSIKHEFYRLSSEATKRLNYHIEFYIFQLAKSTNSLLTSDLLQDWMQNGQALHLDDEMAIENEMRGKVAQNFPEIVGMFLLTPDQRVLSMTNLPLNGYQSYQQEPWYNNSFNEEVSVLPTHTIQYATVYNVRVVSLEIPIYSKASLQLLGKLVIDFQLDEINRTFMNAELLPEGSFFVVSKDDQMVYHLHNNYLGVSRSETELGGLDLFGDQKATVQQLNGEKHLIASSLSESTGWTFVHTVPLVSMYTSMQNTSNVILYTILIIAICIFIIVPMIANRIVRPILGLKQLMLKVEHGDLSVRAPVSSGRDELQHLHKSFNTMVEQIEELVDTVSAMKVKEANLLLKEKEALIKALQNQINPHFLYNSIDIIKSIAYLKDVPEIVSMSRNLADFYRYTAIEVNHVTLRDELKHLKHYLALLHVRFPDHFHSFIDVDEKLYECTVIKLMIQPLVENSVKYGIEPNEGNGSITVSVSAQDGELMIKIIDTGGKISKKEIESLNHRLMYITNNIHKEYSKQKNLGLYNVHARIVLKYGGQYGLAISFDENKRTVVSIRLPVLYPVKLHEASS
jgi:two-component system, sensor histidine kinase YesM